MDIAFLCSPSLGEFQRRVVASFLAADSAHRIVGCVIDSQPRPSLMQRVRKNRSRGRGGYMLIMALRLLSRSRSSETDSGVLFKEMGVPIITTEDPYGEETCRRISALRPDVLLLLGGFGILKGPLLTVAPQGVLSYHHGDMRKYRGQPAAFWELYEGEGSIGATVQRLSSGIDCGEPIVERSFAIRETDTLGSLSHRIFEGSADMMFEAVQRLEDPSFRPEVIESFGRLYTLPNLRQWIVFQVRVGRRVLRARMSSVPVRCV